MKKIGFAFQVMGLLTILPLYVILEMNHTNVNSPSTDAGKQFNSPGFDKNAGCKDISGSVANISVNELCEPGLNVK